MALVGIVFVALNLRTAVAAISPIVDEMRVDIDLDSVGLGIIGALPPIAFALSGIFGALLAKKIGLERLTVVAITAMVIGHLARAGSSSYAMLLIGSVVAFAGIGIGNILLPPLVKRYFPDRIGLVTTMYASVLAISTAVPAALAAPIADTSSWRWSLGIWSVLAALSLIPWVAVLLQHRRERATTAADASPEIVERTPHALSSLVHSRTAWAVTLVFALSGFHAYTSFAWLPRILIDVAGVTPAEAGGLLALYGIVGLPAALVVPLLAVRMRNVGILVLVGISAFLVGYLGLLLAPTTLTPLWVILAGLGTLLFPVALVLINLRTRTQEGSVALSGFVQGIGYAISLVGPLLVGLLHDSTGGWTLPIVVLIVTLIACIIPALMLRHPAFIEDELAARADAPSADRPR